MGYRDLNLIVSVVLKDEDPHPDKGKHEINPVTQQPYPHETTYLCEVQINHLKMLEAKKLAHKDYEVVRTLLPEICEGTGVDPGLLEAFIVQRLNSGSLDFAVRALSKKAGGLFLFARLLEQQLEADVAAGRVVDFSQLHGLPNGLAEVYETNFTRAFPSGPGGPEWAAARPLIELISAAQEPLTLSLVYKILDWTDKQRDMVLDATGTLFPVREKRFHVFHKTVVDWLTGQVQHSHSRSPTLLSHSSSCSPQPSLSHPLSHRCSTPGP